MKLFKVACLLIAALCCLGHEVDIPDELTDSGYNGTAAVHAVLTVIESTQIFQNFSHHRFLRRLAKVTSNDGTTYISEDDMLADGGIWGIDDSKLNAMRETAKENSTIAQELKAVDKCIDTFIGVSILDANFTVALKPIYGGAAAYLYLYYLKLLKSIRSVPLAENKIGQADLWVNHFCIQERRPCCRDCFVAQVAILEKQEGIISNTATI